ncbi:hypothetical protein R3P38DRAFT_3263162 [Favolaschia claudopus]|uniref:Uncharacterized protein n=1 Tax=Favolaschia claudopus TaxID=2862362 RepID=A0AAW0CA86_9AGAR
MTARREREVFYRSGAPTKLHTSNYDHAAPRVLVVLVITTRTDSHVKDRRSTTSKLHQSHLHPPCDALLACISTIRRTDTHQSGSRPTAHMRAAFASKLYPLPNPYRSYCCIPTLAYTKPGPPVYLLSITNPVMDERRLFVPIICACRQPRWYGCLGYAVEGEDVVSMTGRQRGAEYASADGFKASIPRTGIRSPSALRRDEDPRNAPVRYRAHLSTCLQAPEDAIFRRPPSRSAEERDVFLQFPSNPAQGKRPKPATPERGEMDGLANRPVR